MAVTMVPDEVKGEPDQADLSKAFGFYFLSVTDFKWGEEQRDPTYSFKRSLCLLCGCGLYKVKRRSKETRC